MYPLPAPPINMKIIDGEQMCLTRCIVWLTLLFLDKEKEGGTFPLFSDFIRIFTSKLLLLKILNDYGTEEWRECSSKIKSVQYTYSLYEDTPIQIPNFCFSGEFAI